VKKKIFFYKRWQSIITLNIVKGKIKGKKSVLKGGKSLDKEDFF